MADSGTSPLLTQSERQTDSSINKTGYASLTIGAIDSSGRASTDGGGGVYKSAHSQNGPLIQLPPMMLIIIGYLGCLLTTGVVFGWSALEAVLVDDGVYLELCDGVLDDDGTCDDRQDRFVLCYTLAMFALNITVCFFGPVLDKYGSRIASICGCIFLAGGAVLCAYSYILEGIIFIALAGPGLQAAFLHVFIWFPRQNGLLVQIVTGLFDAGTLVFYIFYVLHFSYGYGHYELFLGYCIVPALVFFISLLFWSGKSGPEVAAQKAAITAQLALEEKKTQPAPAPVESASPATFPSADDESTSLHARDLPFEQQVRDSRLWYLILFVSVHMFRFNYYAGTAYDQLRYYHDNDKATQLNDLFNLILIFGFLIIPFGAWTLDTKRTWLLVHFVNISGLFWGVGVILINYFGGWTAVAIAYPSYLLLAFVRQLVFSICIKAIIDMFGHSNYGKMLAVQKVVIAFTSLMLYPYNYWALELSDGDYLGANIFAVAMVIPLLPINRWVNLDVRD